VNKKLELPRGVGPIGLEITHRWVTAAQLRGAGRGSAARLLGVLRWSRPTPGAALHAEEAERIAGALDRAGFAGESVVVNAPEDALLSAVLELPPRSSKAPIERLAMNEMARLHRRETGTFGMAMWDLPASDRGRAGTTAMAVALPDGACEGTLSATAIAGLRAVAVEPRACAVGRACGAFARGMQGLVGVLDLGWTHTLLMLLHVAGDESVVVYERRIDEGAYSGVVQHLRERLGLDESAAEAALRTCSEDGGRINPKITELLRTVRRYQSDFFDALLPEVHRSFSYAVQRYPAASLCGVCLTGEGAAVRGLRSRVASALSVDAWRVCARDVAAVHERSALGGDAASVGAIGLAAYEPGAASPGTEGAKE